MTFRGLGLNLVWWSSFAGGSYLLHQQWQVGWLLSLVGGAALAFVSVIMVAVVGDRLF